MAPQIIQKRSNFQIFFSEFFFTFKGGGNKISWSYSLLHITKHHKRPRFSIFRTVVIVPTEFATTFNKNRKGVSKSIVISCQLQLFDILFVSTSSLQLKDITRSTDPDAKLIFLKQCNNHL